MKLKQNTFTELQKYGILYQTRYRLLLCLYWENITFCSTHIIVCIRFTLNIAKYIMLRNCFSLLMHSSRLYLQRYHCKLSCHAIYFRRKQIKCVEPYMFGRLIFADCSDVLIIALNISVTFYCRSSTRFSLLDLEKCDSITSHMQTYIVCG